MRRDNEMLRAALACKTMIPVARRLPVVKRSLRRRLLLWLLG
jgi:hypothetical protein